MRIDKPVFIGVYDDKGVTHIAETDGSYLIDDNLMGLKRAIGTWKSVSGMKKGIKIMEATVQIKKRVE